MDLFGLWYGLAFGATAAITYTDVKAYWIPNAPVVVLAVGIYPGLGPWPRPTIGHGRQCDDFLFSPPVRPLAEQYRQW